MALFGLAPIAHARAEVPVLVLDGTGYGHGVGLSQWGAEYLARNGKPLEAILATFYPGAGLGEATGSVRVAVHRPAAATTTLTFPQGGEVRSNPEGAQQPGFPVRVGPGGRVRISYDGAYRVEALVSARSGSAATRYRQEPCPLVVMCTPPSTAPPSTTTTQPPEGPPPSDGGSPGQPGDGARQPRPRPAARPPRAARSGPSRTAAG